MTDFTPWIRPTLLGPFLTSWALTTLSSLTVGAAVATFGYFDDWLVAMLIVSFFAGLCVTSLIFSDLVLLKLKLRALPTGAAAWLTSLAAPIAIWMAWAFFGLDGETVLETVLRIAAPIAIVPFVLRLVLGRAP